MVDVGCLKNFFDVYVFLAPIRLILLALPKTSPQSNLSDLHMVFSVNHPLRIKDNSLVAFPSPAKKDLPEVWKA